MFKQILVIIYGIFGLLHLAGSQCTWPSAFVSSTWVDNVHGDLVFGNTTMSGWSFSIATGGIGQYINDWQCVISDQFDTDGYLVMRSINDFTLFVTSQYYAYVCLKMKRITDFSYRYYIFEPEQANINGERYLVLQNGGLSTIGTTCYESYGASGSEYRVLLKSGSESQAQVGCPWVFLGRFDYQHTASGVTTCSSGNNDLDVCTNKEMVAFDFTQCPTDVAYSGQTSVSCIDNVPVGTDTFVTTYTSATVDGTNTFKFACFGVSHDLTTVSVAPEYCRKLQSTSTAPTGGALVTLTSITELCRTCDALTNPDGGNVTIQTDGADTVAYYACATEYDMYGDSTRTCQSDETWTGSPPVCKCKFPSIPSNGNVTVTSDGLLATYTCDPGYVLTGNQYRTCQANGNAWNGTDPTCDTCDSLTNITNGITQLSSEGITTIASFTCNINYTLTGSRLMACQSDGTWNDTTPSCVACNSLATPVLGGITMTTDGYQSLATFSCDAGYQISGVNSLTCQTDGQWNGTEPSCTCESPSAPVSGSVSISSDGMMANYTCNTGYTLSGVTTRECLLNGSSWTNTPPTCQLCSNLTDVTGRIISYTSDGFITVAEYSCQSGYTLNGDRTSVCNTDGTWSQTSTSCAACPSLTSLSAGNVSLSTNGTVSMATFSCSSGYDLIGDMSLTCQADGTWTDAEPTCTCTTPNTPANGAINVSMDVVLYTCNVGYTLQGVSTRFCLYDASGWNGSEPTCTLCNSLSTPLGGNYTLRSDDGLYTYALFTCITGYTMVGTAVLSCKTDGTWNASSPTCTQCDQLPSPANGSVSFTTDGQTTIGTFRCDEGTSMSDTVTTSSQCNTDGTWTIGSVTCEICEVLPSLSSGNQTYSTNGTSTTVDYNCNAGYHINGDSSRTCYSNGSWTGSDPTCVCDSPGGINNGSFTLSSDGISAVYTCDSGYSLVGTSNLNCQTDGSGWDSAPPTCFKCDNIAGPSNGNVTLSTNGTSSLATYLCAVGYTLSGTITRMCQSDGTWTLTSPSCVLCGSLSSPAAGSFTLIYNGTNTQALFTCDTGYYLHGGASSLLTCMEDGTWDSSEPTCVCEVPAIPVNGAIAVSSDGLTVNYSCETKYSLNGTGHRICNLDGSSWTNTEPACVTCGTLQNIARGNITFTTDGQTTVAQYTCDVGSTLSGGNTRSCDTDGTWDGSQPSCVECPSLGSLSSGQVSITTDGSTTSAVFNCTTGYYINGDTTTQCLSTGQWSNTVPSCVCEAPSVLTDGHLVLSNNNMTVTYTCDAGYILSGSSIQTCGTDGSGWSGTQPTCVTCEPAISPTNGTVNVTTDGTITEALYSCESGSTLQGNSVLTCTQNGTWDLAPPTCVTCPSLTAVSSGSTTISTNGTLSLAQFACSAGYSIVGDTALLCQTDGLWSGNVPQCVCDPPSTPVNSTMTVSTDGLTVMYTCNVGTSLSGPSVRNCQNDGSGWTGTDPLCVSCPDISSPSNGLYSLFTDGYNTTTTFNCSSGYTLSGVTSVTCLASGFWSGAAPTCVQCSSLSSPDSGSVTIDTDGTSSRAVFTCDTGYQINGNSILSCLSIGAWDAVEPSCVCLSPSSPTNGNVEISGDFLTATYTCTAGYTLQGQSSRTCQTGGAGWTDSQPSCSQCHSLTNPLGGSITVATTGTVTQAVFSCSSGYTLNGLASLTCRDDGTWDISAPSCSSCSTLSTPSNGLVTLSTDGSTTVANFTCTVGYTLSGNSHLTCKADGSWDFTSPSCVKCQALSSVPAGSVSIRTNDVTTSAEITCMPGYYVSGETNITCQSDGTWTDALPSCVCNVPSSPANGSQTVSNAGMTVTYSCDIGYTMVGNEVATCDVNGAGWSSIAPTCVLCANLNPSNNTVSSSISNGTTTIVTYTCSVGSSVSGTPTLSCLDSGNWTSGEPNCVECPSLLSPTNGTLTTNTNGTSTVATFTCIVGFTLNGSDTLTCQADGTWNNLEPTCSKCDSLTAVSSGSYSLSTSGVMTTASFTCVTGYFLDGSSQITCASDGTWSAGQPTCACNAPASPTNGNMWISGDGMTLTYTCELGYSIQGETTNTCNNDGTGWLYPHPTCNLCQTLVSPTNGNFTLYTNGTFTNAAYSCEAGYSLSTETDVSVCTNTGVWNLTSPTCVKCEDLTAPSSGIVSIVSIGSSTTAMYSCMTGYDLEGVTQRSCLTNGTWDLSAPTCVCQSPTVPSNGGIQISADKQTVTYSCDEGYSLNGVTTRLCAVDGTGWSDTDPQCVPCATLSTLSGGVVAIATDGQTTTANFTCNSGYSLSGTKLLSCRSDGTWDFSAPTCVTCDSLTVSSFGSQTVTSDGTKSTVMFECNNGYTLLGTSQATCSSSGTWDSSEPTCVECANLTNPNSGTVNIVTNGTVTIATHTCSAGYSIIGESTLTCQNDGSWDSQQPTCVCDPPSTPVNGNTSLSDSGYTATFTCESGYTLAGDNVVTCSQASSGWNGSTPSCVQCRTVTTPDNGTLTTYTDGTTTVVTVGCDEGFTASGSNNLTCQTDGTFDVVTPQCVQCSDLPSISNGNQQFSSTGSQTLVAFTCDLGYSLEGQRTSACISNGTWTSAVPACVECVPIPTITSGSHILNTNGTATTATVQCTTGYIISGSETITCDSNGFWESQPSCICEDPSAPSNGNVTANGQLAVFTCDVGYSLNGSQVSYCKTDGTGWNTSVPVCVGCSATTPLTVGTGDMFSDGLYTYIMYTCPVGYTLSGNQTITCEDTGTWSSVEPNCTSCVTLRAPDNGNISITTDNVTTSAFYTCSTGYYLEGTSRTCLEDGSWSDSDPVCYCVAPSSPLNGQVQISADRGTASYTCDVGYTIDGHSTRLCQNDSTGWSEQQPSCTLCSTLTTPSGGQIITSTDGTSTIATVTCGSGYTLAGSQTLECRSDGSWNTSVPTCVTCVSLTSPSGGSYVISTNGVTSVVQYTCDAGYTLSGNNDILCSTTGQWIGQAPTCESCATLTTPDSGSMVTVTDGFTTTAIFSCDQGYYISNTNNLTCNSDGLWDAIEPECFCVPPTNITNGNYMLSANLSVVTYSCDTGYTLNGSTSRLCQGSGQGWLGNDPSCVQCAGITPPSGGSVVATSNGSTTITSYTCDVGSTISGDVILECRNDGTWSSVESTCVECPSPSIPSYGNYSLTTNGTQTTVEFSCNVGYSLDGDSSASCETSATWTSGTPLCVQCASLKNITNGDMSLSTNGTVTMSTFTCVTDYYLIGSSSLECRTDGSWDVAEPACVCDPPLSIVNGNYTISDDKMTVQYECDLGFTMSGSSTRTCDGGGSGWLGSPPTCTSCTGLASISNGNIVLTTNGTYTTATFECDAGYSVDSSDYQATCNSDGTWNVTVPACVQCSTLNTITNGNVTLNSNGPESVGTYYCLPAYTLTGDQVRVCQHGIWNGTEPVCLCTYSTYLENGDAVSDGTTINYTCEAGYTLNGASTRTCLNDGTGWSLSQPVCVLCQTLTTPTAGNMTLSTDGLESTVQFTCMKGYTLTGSSQLTCRTDGTWNSVEPSCGVPCSALSVPQSGDVTLETDGLTTTAHYVCDVGYNLVGSAVLTCRSDGSWDLTESTCVQCQALFQPNNGYVVQSSDGSTSVATYTCHTDYYLEGSNTSTCLTDGSWNNPPPTCYCLVPGAPGNGSVTLSNDKGTATFTCNTGFTLQGDSAITCQNNYTGWSGNTPTCVYCGSVSSIQNGISTVLTDGTVSTVVHTCNTGYTLSGSTNGTCSDNGTWLEQFPTCVSCQSLLALAHGSTVLNSDGLQTYAQFTCNLGYSMQGEDVLYCLADGTWNSSTPVCVQCEAIPALSSGSRTDTTDGITTHVTFTCVTGYHIEGIADLSCLSDGTWNGTQPSCVCDTPSAPTNGQVTTGFNTSVLQYTCDSGYSLNGQVQRLCSDQGTGWLGVAPTCVECDVLQLTGNLSVTVDSNGTTSVAMFVCDVGYTLVDTEQIRCMENGTWSGDVPSCIRCTEVTSPDSGSVNVASNGSVSQAVFSCVTGYMIQGVDKLYCNSSGLWDATEPVCICDSPVSPVNGVVSSDGITAEYTCDTGYTIYGDSTRTCQQSGLGWNATQPSCTACSSLDAVSGGTVVMTTDGTMTTAAYTCDVGYTMFGSNTLTCRSDGTWDFNGTQCVTCETLSVPDNGNINMTSNGDMTTAMFTCNVGYTLKGTSLLTCRTDGTWDFTVPNCAQCPDLVPPDSGAVNVTSNGEVSTAVYTCVDGYYLSAGDVTRTCGTDGVWNGMAPSCVCDIPATPSNGNLTMSTGNMTVQFMCDVGYTLSGLSVLGCNTDGTGWNGSLPSCYKCDNFTAIANSSIQFVTDGQSSVAIVTCDTGTSLIGQSEIECQTDGTWNIVSTTLCEVCPDLSSPVGGSIMVTSNGSVTVAEFTCDTNYSMSGSHHLECLNTGLWDNSSPSCVQCASITAPASGSVMFNSDGYTTSVTYSCISGYEVMGNSILYCLDDGTWNATQSYCVCEPPSSPLNGALSLSGDKSEASFSCDVGYSLNGMEISNCDINGAGWNSATPACVTCSPLSGLANGNVTLLTNQTSTYASYTCDIGYTLSDDVIRTCLNDGSWTFTDPTCVPCPALPSPSSGTAVITSDGTASSVNYECALGYNLQGLSTRTCLTDGQWNGTEPTCTCQLPASIDKGNVAFGANVSIALYTCNNGHSLNGTSQRYCQTDGTGWDSVAPTCVVCETLSSISGGTVSINTDGLTTSALYTCDVGYTLVGESNLTCRADGTWNLQAPTCVSCSALTVPAGGSVVMSSTESVTQATFTCTSGYTLLGTAMLTCKSTGTWDFTVPDCVLCPTLQNPSSGNVTVSTDGQTSTAMFTCGDQYYLDGTVSLTCQTNGLWHESSPVCKCIPPPVIMNGNYTLSDNGTVLTHSCNIGYSMNGDPIQLCDADGNGWLGNLPNCSLCDSLVSQVNGSWSVSTDGVSTVATFTCDNGYTLSGESVVACQTDGTWNIVQPTCEQCAEITPPTNGSIIRTTNGTMTHVSVTCDLGYTLGGASQLSCLTNGSWSEPTPTCVLCPSLSTIDNGYMISSTNGTVTMMLYSCSNGYSIHGNTNLYCDTSGSWNSIPPACLCDAFMNPSNGAIEISDNGTVATYSCGSGYTLSGDTTVTCESTIDTNGGNFTAPSCTTCSTLSSTAGSSITLSTDGHTTSALIACDLGYTLVGATNLTCRSDGTWDINTPSCAVCDILTTPSGGNVTFHSDGSETVARFLCYLGYTMVGTNTLTCRSDGTWNFDVPSCVECPTLTTPTSGLLSTTTDGSVTMATISCDSDYYINGDSVLICGTDGIWSSTTPTCVCTPPTSLDNGYISLSTDGMNITFSCNHGYTMSGNHLQTCASDGSGWSGSLPNCTKCADLQSLTDGTITTTTDGQITMATYTCSVGYSINGITELSCRADGTWNFSEPTCGVCSNLSAPTNGNMEYQTNGSVTSVLYTCNAGYTLDGNMSASCLSDGTWDSVAPVCVTCPTLDDPDNGQIAVSTNGSVSIATLSCNQGYDVVGEVTLTCRSSGQWSHTTPSCLCDAFMSLSNGAIEISDNGTVATYSCGSGYTLSGDTTITCESTVDTNGGNFTAPSCTACSTLSSTAGSSITLSTNGHTTSALIACDLGYTLVGATNLTCRSDGTWDINTPSCAVCDSLTTPSGGNVTFNSDGSETVATFLCYLGYTMVGTKILTCRSDGTWNFDVPSCVACPTLTTPTSGQLSTSTDGSVTMATVSCDSDYYINGDSVLTCGTDGIWSSTTPTCVCIPPTSLDNGNISLSTDGMNITYSCNHGYTISGNHLQTCTSDGSGWSGSLPNCTKCSDLQSLTNGTISMTTDGQVTMATYTCSVGYSISGVTELSCTVDGTWDFSEPTCESCQMLTLPVNGSYTVQSNGTVTSVVYQCEKGTSLLGPIESVCGSDGTWINGAPTCASCPELDSPYNGAVLMSSNGSVTMATYSCISGYSIVGEGTISCLTNGQWSHSPPTCFCDDFTQLVDGNIELLDNGTKATYTCDNGYTLNGDQAITCGTASATYVSPTCTTCDSLTVPTGSSVTMTTDNTTTFATLTCDTGYTVVGDNSLTCRSDGTWDISTPTCVLCQTLDYPVGSSINITTLDSVTIALVSCVEGYTLKGATSLTCRSDGSWDFAMPTCVQCPALSDPQAGNVSVTTDGSTTTALYSCTDGYYIDGVSMATCNTSGSWTSLPPICKCTAPSSLANGSYVISSDGFTVTYSCDVGFTMSGTDIRSCDTNGQGWSEQEPVCVTCDEILTDSSVTLSLNGTTSTAEFTCESGYSIAGSFNLVCNENGTWSGDFPSCQQCTSLAAPENGTITLLSNGTTSSVTFTCKVGTTLNGESEAICTDTGLWSFQQPLCVSCASLSNPMNGVVTMETNGTVTLAKFTCDSGYSLVGGNVSVCNTNGAWSLSSPTCECEIFGEISNGNMNVSDNGTKATYTCAEGYTLSGVSEQDCTVNTSTITLPTCVSCNTLLTSSGSSVTVATDGTTTLAVVTCDVGYTISSDHIMACKPDGSWNISTPSCVVCDALPASSGVNITMTSNGQVTTAVFACPYGFTLNGSAMLECRTDGSWNFESPSCDCDLPLAIVNGEMTVSGGGLTVTYTCNLGYSLSGSTSRTCATDGTWWSGSDPNCTECTTTSLSEGLNRTLFTDGVSTMAYFQCSQGYTISHRRNLTCLDNGSWDDSEPTCVSCPALNSSTGLSYESVSDGLMTSVSFTCADGYTMTGAVVARCLENGAWDVSFPTCSLETVTAPTECNNQNGAAIGLGIVFAIAAILAIIFAVLAWRYRKLYKGLGGSKASHYSADNPNWILQDMDKFKPSKAPVGHQHHVMDLKGMSRASSRAPLSFSKHNLEADITLTPSPAMMTSRKMGAHKLPRSITSTTFQTESTNLSASKTRTADSRSSSLGEQISSPGKEDKEEHFPDIPTLRLDETLSSFAPIKPDKNTARLSALSEQRYTSLTPSSILISQDISRGDSPLPQQILTPRNDDDIRKEENAKKSRKREKDHGNGKREKDNGKKTSSSKTESNVFTELRSGSTLYNDTIASKLKKRSKDFVDTGATGLEVPSNRRSRTPSPSFKEVDVTDIENDVSDVEV